MPRILSTHWRDKYSISPCQKIATIRSVRMRVHVNETGSIDQQNSRASIVEICDHNPVTLSRCSNPKIFVCPRLAYEIVCCCINFMTFYCYGDLHQVIPACNRYRLVQWNVFGWARLLRFDPPADRKQRIYTESIYTHIQLLFSSCSASPPPLGLHKSGIPQRMLIWSIFYADLSQLSSFTRAFFWFFFMVYSTTMAM